MMSEPPEDIADCTTHAERAAWLLRTSIDQLRRDELHIRRWLRWAGFPLGNAYLDEEFRQLRSPRREDGSSFNQIDIAVARGRMVRVACGLPSLGLGA